MRLSSREPARPSGHHDGARFRLPPGVVKRQPEGLHAPNDGFGVERLTHARHEAQLRVRAGADERDPGLHQHAYRGRRRVPDADLFPRKQFGPALRIELLPVHDHRHAARPVAIDEARGDMRPAAALHLSIHGFVRDVQAPIGGHRELAFSRLPRKVATRLPVALEVRLQALPPHGLAYGGEGCRRPRLCRHRHNLEAERTTRNTHIPHGRSRDM
jgi:hypothetical protein